MIERFVRLALTCIHRTYPHALVQVLRADEDIRSPRELHPAFCGCFDWHSAVHSHWLLVRALHVHPGETWTGEVRQSLRRNLNEINLAREAEYLRTHPGFEWPYGLAWLLQLAAELREMPGDDDAASWLRWIEPLERLAADRFTARLPKLTHPVRTGEHSQTAFAMGLALDWARTAGNTQSEQMLLERARYFFAADVHAPLRYEPSGYDFLSPALAEADLLRRVMPRQEFARWLERFLPPIPRDGSDAWLAPVRSPDSTDGKLAHLDGLNLSRAWMLQGIAAALAPDDPRRPALLSAADRHADAGILAIDARHYAGAHWLGSFAVYLLTRRGCASALA